MMIRFTVLDRQPPPGPKARPARRFIFNGGGGGGGGRCWTTCNKINIKYTNVTKKLVFLNK